MKTRWIDFFMTLSFPILALASGDAQIARFTPWLETIRKPLTSSQDIDTVADALLNGETRVAAFNLQALGRLYGKQDELFKDVRSNFKEMEDAIGEYDKWVQVLKSAQQNGQNDSAIKKLKKRVKEARASFVAFLQKEEWVVSNGKSKIDKIQKSLESRSWSSYPKDRQDNLKELQAQLKKVNETEYDMTILENGNGLHELRRELRWFLIESRVLNGLVTFRKDKTCSVEEFKDLLKDKELVTGKYSQLPQAKTETDPCLISQCLFLAIVDDVAKLGDLKDKAERLNNSSGDTESDDVPQELANEAQDIYQTLQNTQALSLLSNELKSCTH
jgi:hypothetical protein